MTATKTYLLRIASPVTTLNFLVYLECLASHCAGKRWNPEKSRQRFQDLIHAIGSAEKPEELAMIPDLVFGLPAWSLMQSAHRHSPAATALTAMEYLKDASSFASRFSNRFEHEMQVRIFAEDLAEAMPEVETIPRADEDSSAVNVCIRDMVRESAIYQGIKVPDRQFAEEVQAVSIIPAWTMFAGLAYLTDDEEGDEANASMEAMQRARAVL